MGKIKEKMLSEKMGVNELLKLLFSAVLFVFAPLYVVLTTLFIFIIFEFVLDVKRLTKENKFKENILDTFFNTVFLKSVVFFIMVVAARLFDVYIININLLDIVKVVVSAWQIQKIIEKAGQTLNVNFYTKIKKFLGKKVDEHLES